MEKNVGVVAEFIFPDGQKENYSSAILPCLPRVGDKVRSATPQSGVYRVSCVIFLIHDFQAAPGTLPGSTVQVELAALDEIAGMSQTMA